MSGAWLLEIDTGRIWRASTRHVTYDGNAYLPALAEVSGPVDGLSLSEPQDRSAQVVVHPAQLGLDTDDISLGAVGRLYWWEDPDGLDPPELLLSGRLEAPEYGAHDEPLTTTIREVPWEDRARIPDVSTARIDSTSWPNAVDGLDGEWYPEVIGLPGIDAEDVMGSPAYYVQQGGTKYVLLSRSPVVASSVELRDQTGPSTFTGSPIRVADGYGQIVTVVNVGAWAALAVDDQVWATWDGSTGGIPAKDDPSRAMRGAGEVIAWALGKSSLRVDWGRQRAAEVALNAYQVDGYIAGTPGARPTPWEWLARDVLPILPVVVRQSSRGVYVVVLRPDAPEAAATVTLEEGRNCWRVSPVGTVGEHASEVSMMYAPRADGDGWARRVVVSGQQDTLRMDPSALRHAAMEESYRRFGPRAVQLTSPTTYDDSTAVRAARAMASLVALPAREVSYEIEEGLRVEPGDVVRLTDAGLGWTRRVVLGWSVLPGPRPELTVRHYYSSARDKGGR